MSVNKRINDLFSSQAKPDQQKLNQNQDVETTNQDVETTNQDVETTNQDVETTNQDANWDRFLKDLLLM